MGKYLDKQGVETLWNKTKALNGQKQDRTSDELTTEAKSIVEAINEVNGKASAGLRLLGTLSPGDPAPAAEQSADGYYLATQPGQYFNGAWLHKTHIGIVTQQDGRWKIKFVRTAPMPKPRVIAWRAIPLKTARPGDIYIISQQPWLKVGDKNGVLDPLGWRGISPKGLSKLIIPQNWANMDKESAIDYIRENVEVLNKSNVNLTLSSPYLKFNFDSDPNKIVSTHPPFAIYEYPLMKILHLKNAPASLDLSRMMATCDYNRTGNPHRVRSINKEVAQTWSKLFDSNSNSGRLIRRKYFTLRRARAITKKIKKNETSMYAVKYIHKSSVIARYMRYNQVVKKGKQTEYNGIVLLS